MADSIRPFLERIRTHARESGRGASRLARDAGLSVNACRRLFDEDWDPRVSTVEKLLAVVPPSSNVDGSRDAA